MSASIIALLLVLAGNHQTGPDSEPPSIDEGWTVAVVVEGLDDEARTNVLATLAIRRAEDTEVLLSTVAVRGLHGQATHQIQRALEPFGYYRPTVEAHLDARDERWHARYVVTPGDRVPLTSVDVTLAGPGRDEVSLAFIVANVDLAPGALLDHRLYEQAKAALLDAATELGYFDAEFTTSAVRVDVKQYGAEVALRFETGVRYRFGAVTFLQEVVDPSILIGHIPFAPGAHFQAAALRLLQASLQASDLWELVVVHPRRDQAADLMVPIEVSLVPRKRRRDAVGIGFSTNTGPRGSGSFSFRRLNRAGHRAHVDLKVSEIDRSGGLRYVIPRAEAERGILRFEGGYEERMPNSNEDSLIFIGSSLARIRGRSRHVYSLRVEQHDFDVASDSGVISLLIPGFSWSRVQADNRFRPRHGHRVALQVRVGTSAEDPRTSFLWTSFRGKLIRSLSPRWRVIGRFDAGTTLTDRFAALPPSLRFFAGGDDSVRGFGYQDLGPQDAAGAVRGGDLLLVASGELEARFLQDWGAAVFLDAGNAFSDFDQGELATGAGIGLRWFSPIGTIRIDVAWALSEPDRPIRLHLGLGLEL